MSKLVVTNIRLPKDELMEYRQMALSEGKSFSQFTRAALAEKVHATILGKKKRKTKIRKEDEPIWDLGKYAIWRSNVRDGSINHDTYIYGNPHGDRKRT